MHGQHVAGPPLGGRQGRLDGGQLVELVHLFDDRSRNVVASSAGSEESERRRLPDDGADLELGQVDGAALLHSEGREADGADRRSKSGNSRRGRLDADVVGAGRSAADADAAAAAGKSRVRGAEGDCEITLAYQQQDFSFEDAKLTFAGDKVTGSAGTATFQFMEDGNAGENLWGCAAKHAEITGTRTAD